jgi:hypothetical protein
MLLEMISNDFLHASAPGELSGALGATRAEQLAFVDVALGRVDLRLQRRPVSARPADIAIIDQNLPAEDDPSLPTLYGTELVSQLRVEGFGGVCCILTGASDEEIHAISAFPGVDLALPKITKAAKLTERLLAAAEERARRLCM